MLDIKKLEQMGMEQGFSHVALLDCDTIELNRRCGRCVLQIHVISIISAGAARQGVALLRSVKRKFEI